MLSLLPRAQAQSAEATLSAVPPAAPAPAPKKPKYSLPWGLRPALPPNVVRSDSSLALTDTGTAFASTLLGGGKVMPDLGVYGKIALTYNSPDNNVTDSAAAVSNALAFGVYSPELAPGIRLPLTLGATIPFGMGGGDEPDKDASAAQAAGIYARSALENALFAANYFTVIGGAGLVWIHDRLTLQGEVTVLQLFRARGEKVEKDSSRTNFTSGFHAGYAVIDQLTLSAEVRYQRWLSEPNAVKLDATRRDQLTAGLGLRANLPVGKLTVRPGFAYFQGVDDPMAKVDYRVLTFDVPVLF